MRILDIDNEAREHWPLLSEQPPNVDGGKAYQTDWPGYGYGTGTITKGRCGVSGVPAAPAGDPTLDYVLTMANTGTGYCAMQLPNCKSIRVEHWMYIDVTTVSSSSSFLGVEQRKQLGTVNGRGSEEVKCYLATVSAGDGRFKIIPTHADTGASADGGVGNTAAWVVWSGAAQVVIPDPFGAWYKYVLELQASSVAGAADGICRQYLYAADGTTLLGSAEKEDVAWGGQCWSTLRWGDYRTPGQDAPAGTLHHGRTRVWDKIGDDWSDAPDILCSWLHTPDDDSVYCKIIADRPLSSCSVNYVYSNAIFGGQYVQATPVALADSDGGRVWQFRMTGLVKGVEYAWRATLNDGVSAAAVSEIDGRTPMVYLPTADESYGVVMVSDHHQRSGYGGEARLLQINKAVAGRTLRLLLLGGDDAVIAPEALYAIDRAWARTAYANWFYFIRSLSCRMVAVATPGNHDAWQTSSILTYLPVITPRLEGTYNAHQAVAFGCAEIYAFDHEQYNYNAGALPAIEGWLTTQMTAGDRPLQVMLQHENALDQVASGEVASNGDSMGATQRAAIHTLLQTKLDGQLPILMHGHQHGGSYWYKDGVIYIGCNAAYLGAKDASYGDFVLIAGDKGSALQSIEGYGGVDGSAGWLACVFSPKGIVVRIFDSYVDAAGYHARKRFEQRRMVR